MAKTRIKTTPTRLQKDTLTADDIKKRLRQVNSKHSSKESVNVTSSVLVAAPKRSHSLSSAAATSSPASVASDVHSANSESEFTITESLEEEAAGKPPPTAATQPRALLEQQNPSIKTLNNLLDKQGGDNKNRKIFMITERCDDDAKDASATHSSSKHGINGNNGNSSQLASAAHKRKMYLIMEEASSPPQQQQQQHQQQQQQQQPNNGDAADFPMSLKDELNGNSSKKKLILFADRCDAQLTQKFEKILPEILQCINSKVKDQQQATKTTATVLEAAKHQNGESQLTAPTSHVKREPVLTCATNSILEATQTPSKQPITLPPKKNRTKIINTGVPTYSLAAAAAAAAAATTPVIVSPAQVLTGGGKYSMAGNNTVSSLLQQQQPHERNINLSTDFLFLMKILPKLEAIPEPHKNHVKNCIEKIVTQNAALFHEQQ